VNNTFNPVADLGPPPCLKFNAWNRDHKVRFRVHCLSYYISRES